MLRALVLRGREIALKVSNLAIWDDLRMSTSLRKKEKKTEAKHYSKQQAAIYFK